MAVETPADLFSRQREAELCRAVEQVEIGTKQDTHWTAHCSCHWFLDHGSLLLLSSQVPAVGIQCLVARKKHLSWD